MNFGMKISFEKAAPVQLDAIFNWLAQDFVMEYWDNTQAHGDDIINFVDGRKTPSTYAGGKYHLCSFLRQVRPDILESISVFEEWVK